MTNILTLLLAVAVGFLVWKLYYKPTPKYTWRPEATDPRDLAYTAKAPALPSSDLTAGFPPPFNQKSLGSCTGNGWAAVVYFLHNKLYGEMTLWSRLFIYWMERWIEGTIHSDAGAQIRDGAKALAKYGVCPETLWPYILSKFKLRPPQACWDVAAKTKISQYLRIADLDGIRACLSEGWPVVGGIVVYESFESAEVARTGSCPMPKPGERNLGGHCIVFVGHNDATRRIKFRNSWDKTWGDGGYGYLPYEYFTTPGYNDDNWTARK